MLSQSRRIYKKRSDIAHGNKLEAIINPYDDEISEEYLRNCARRLILIFIFTIELLKDDNSQLSTFFKINEGEKEKNLDNCSSTPWRKYG